MSRAGRRTSSAGSRGRCRARSRTSSRPLPAVRGRDRVPRPLLALPADDPARVGLRARAPGRRAPRQGDQRSARRAPVLRRGQRSRSRSSRSRHPLSAIGLVSLIALLWGASGMMASIRLGLEATMKVERRRPAAHAKLVDFVLVGTAGVLVLLVVALSAFAAFFGRLVDRGAEHLNIDANPSGLLLRDVLQLVLIFSMAFLLYRFVPTRRASAHATSSRGRSSPHSASGERRRSSRSPSTSPTTT